MRLIVSLLLLAAAALAQSPQPAETPLPPPKNKVDKALRERITQFYELQMAGKPRQAEELVASDTKDYYYSSGKPTILSFKIENIVYFDGYKRARAVISTQRLIPRPGFAEQPMTLPIPSNWKIEKGKWVWFVDPESLRQTAFGVKLPPDAMAAKPGAEQPLPGLPAGLNLAGKVRADRSTLTVGEGESAEIVFSSAAPGMAVVTLDGSPEGFVISPKSVFIKQNETAKVTVKALGGAGAATLKFHIEPSGESIEVTASVAK